MRLLPPLCAALIAAGAHAAPKPQELRAAFAALEDPAAAHAALGEADPLSRDLLDWALLRAGAQGALGFAEAAALLARHPDWPMDDRLQSKIEQLITDETPPALIASFFAERLPVSAPGLAAALRAASPAAQARARAEAWPGMALDQTEQNALIAAHGPALRPHYAARADHLLWRGRSEEAAQMAPLLGADPRADLAARLAYLTNDQRAGVLDAGRGETGGLAYARFGWLLRKGEREAAGDLMLSKRSAEALGQPLFWARQRLNLARRALRAQDGMRAYNLASRSFLAPEDGARFADAEWLAGYAALSFMAAPAKAAEHFERLEAAVTSPISRARAAYWLGEAAAAQGQTENARAAFARAAAHQTSFYGQLAAERIGQPFPNALIEGQLAATPLIADAPLVRALDTLIQAEARGPAYLFARQLGRTAAPRSLAIAGNRMLAREAYFFALRIGKDGARRGEIIAEMVFPLHPLAALEGLEDPAFALAIARQESEFRVDAGSSAGALGLMQLMPGTAEEMSAKLDLPFARNRLLTDWRYNAQLGTGYIAELRAMFGESPVLIAAAYNAGPGRVRDWIAANGDPRLPETDPVAWIEAIPFSETRNYVMRVTEAIRPYEARLTGRAPTRSMAEILRGAKPLIRPRARPVPPPWEAAAPEPARPETGGMRAIRPRARPSSWAQNPPG